MTARALIPAPPRPSDDIQRYIVAAREVASRAPSAVRPFPTGSLPRLMLTVHGAGAFSLGTAAKSVMNASLLSDDEARIVAAEVLSGLARMLSIEAHLAPTKDDEPRRAYWVE